MNPFHDGVGLEQQQPIGQAQVEHRAIVAGPDHNRFVGGQRTRQAADEFEFIHPDCLSNKYSVAKFMALNSA